MAILRTPTRWTRPEVETQSRPATDAATARPQVPAKPQPAGAANPKASPAAASTGSAARLGRDEFQSSPSSRRTQVASSASDKAGALWGKVKDGAGSVASTVVNTVKHLTGADAAREVRPSAHAGMGATVYDGGTGFRLWAPNAQRVQVIGDFNGWDVNNAVELYGEGNGNWSGDVEGAVAGQRYKYVIQGKHGDWRWRNDPRALDVTNSTGDSIIYDPKAFQWKHDWAFKMPDWNEAVIYEMHTGTLNDQPGWGPGNWNSAIDRLDHIKDLGVNVVKVMPAAEFAGDSSWGYNPAFPFAPESAYGSPDDFKRFVDEAHKRGIAVVMDVVYNHFGPSDLPMWDLDGETHGKGGEYFYTDDRAKTPWGDTRPDYGRREVRDYIKDNAMMWLRDYHLDGLRFDATSYIRNTDGGVNPDGWTLMKEINDQVNREFPQKIIIAEDMGGLASVTQSAGAGFDSQWDPNFVHPIRRAVTAGSDADINMFDVAGAITAKYNGDATQRVIYSESHDEAANGKERLPSTIGGWDSGGWHARKKSTLASALALTSPGIPMLLQGQELNEDGHFDDGDPINWDKGNQFPGIVDMHRDLIRLRRNWYNNTQGLQGNNVNTFHINNNDKVLGFHRWDQGGPGDDTIVISNMSGKTFQNYELGLPSDGTWKIRFNSDGPNYSPDFGSIYSGDINAHWGGKDGMPAKGTINLPPYTTIILSKDR